MANNKVMLSNGTTLIDLSTDTVTSAEHIMAGYIGHLADGTVVTGTGSGSGSITITDVTNSTGITCVITTGSTPTPEPTETWETLFEGSVYYNHDDNNAYPYCWITELEEVQFTNGSVWRVTFDGSAYRCTAAIYTFGGRGYGVIGNPYWSVQSENDGTDVPFSFYNTGYGAWSGSADVADSTSHQVKIERLVTTA
jgi:hypothetical protein